jgi:hypothetical protein
MFKVILLQLELEEQVFLEKPLEVTEIMQFFHQLYQQVVEVEVEVIHVQEMEVVQVVELQEIHQQENKVQVIHLLLVHLKEILVQQFQLH